MKILKLATVVAGLVALPFANAFGGGHELAARTQTLDKLRTEVKAECPLTSMWRLRCVELHYLVFNLYQRPEFATRYDLSILDRMIDLGKNVKSSRESLASAIDDTKKLFAHVVNDHGNGEVGIWLTDICSPPKS